MNRWPPPFLASLAVASLLAAAPGVARAQDDLGAREEMVEGDAGHAPVLTRPPALLTTVEPVFPEEAKTNKVSGDVTLQVDIGADGKVADVQVLQSAGHGFDEAATAAVRQFTFSPAEIDGKPASVRIQYTQHFFFREPPPPVVPDAGPPAPPVLPITISGRVLERGSRKPIIGAAVKASGLEEPAITEVGGVFALRLPPGKVDIEVVEPSHHPFKTDEVVAKGERLEVTYFMMPKAVGLYETVVTGDRDKKEVTRYSLGQEELDKVPGSMGDPIRVIDDLPGVARVPFLSGALIVRGATPGESGYYLDGVDIPLLFHLLDGPSVINTEFLDRLDFYPGGFGAEYGRAIGGIVDVATRSPKDDQWHGSAKADLIDSGLFLSAPILPGLTVSAAARRSYLANELPYVLPLFTSAGILVAPTYYDYQFRLDYKPPSYPNNTFRLFVFGSDDVLNVIADGELPGGATFSLNDHQDFQRYSGSWVFRSGKLTISSVPFVGRNGSDIGTGLLQIADTDHVYGLREKVDWAIQPYFTLRFGLDTELISSNFTAKLPSYPLNYRPFPGAEPNLPLMSIGGIVDEYDYGGYIEGDFKFPGRVRVIPGVRLDAFKLEDQWRPNVNPRLTVRWDLGDENEPVTVKGAVGLYSESPGAENLDPRFGNPTEPLESAFQSSVGVEHKFGDLISIDVTGFYNRRFQLAESADELIVEPNGNLQRVLVAPLGLGRAYGIEVLLRHEITRHWFAWVAYTLSWSQEKDVGDATYHWADYDERHILTLIGQYKIGNGWEFGGRFRLTTGLPTTAVVGTTFDADQQIYDPTYGGYNAGRLPTFQQLDLRIDRVFLFDRWILALYLDVQNVLNHQNEEGVIVDYRYVTQIVVPDIPILPTLGIRGSF